MNDKNIPNMEYDEDVVFEGSELYQHLVGTGYDDFVKEKFAKAEENKRVVSESSWWSNDWLLSKSRHVQRLLKTIVTTSDVMSEHCHLSSRLVCDSGLISASDITFVQHFIQPQGTVKSSHRPSWFWLCAVDAATGAVMLVLHRIFSPVLMWPLLIMVFILNLLHAGACINSLILTRRLRGDRQLLQNYLGSAATLRSDVKQILQIVQEMELIARGFTLAMTPGSSTLAGDLDFDLRATYTPLVNCLQEVIGGRAQALRRALLHAISSCPLVDGTEHPSHYLEPEDHTAPVSVRALKRRFQLLCIQESEYIRRLCLCFCPEVQLCQQGLPPALPVLLCDLPSLTLQWRTQTQVSKKYFTALQASEEEEQLPRSESSHGGTYTAVHSLCLHLQAALAKTRKMEKLLLNQMKINEVTTAQNVTQHPGKNVLGNSNETGGLDKGILNESKEIGASFLNDFEIVHKITDSVLLKSSNAVSQTETERSEMGKNSEGSEALSSLEAGIDVDSAMNFIKTEMEACLLCCEEAMLRYNRAKGRSEDTPAKVHVTLPQSHQNHRVRLLEVGDPDVLDEVLEAWVDRDENNEGEEKWTEVLDKETAKREKEQTKIVYKELKNVLTVKAKEWRMRERKAIVRMRGGDHEEVDEVEEAEGEEEECNVLGKKVEEFEASEWRRDGGITINKFDEGSVSNGCLSLPSVLAHQAAAVSRKFLLSSSIGLTGVEESFGDNENNDESDMDNND